MPDYAEVLTAFRRQTGGTPPDSYIEHRAAQLVVSLRMEQLERLDEWATFTAHVEALIQRDERDLASVRGRFEAGTRTPGELSVLACQAHGLRSRIEAFRLVLTLPAELQAQVRATP